MWLNFDGLQCALYTKRRWIHYKAELAIRVKISDYYYKNE